MANPNHQGKLHKELSLLDMTLVGSARSSVGIDYSLETARLRLLGPVRS